MTTKEILTIQKTNEVYAFLDEMWDKVFRYEMQSDSCSKIPEAMCDLRNAIDEAQKTVISNANGIKIKL